MPTSSLDTITNAFRRENAEVVMGDERVPLKMPVDANNWIKVNLDFALEDGLSTVILNFGASEHQRKRQGISDVTCYQG